MNAGALIATDFVPASVPPPLDDGEIHLWFFPQWESAPHAAASTPVRALLATYLDCPAEGVHIDRDEHGKPHVAGAELEFNVSHTGDALLLGLNRRVALGVDLEAVRRKTRAVTELARRYFSPAEAEALEALPENLRRIAFLRLWCAKEAALKAHGRGIGFGLNRIEFAIDSTGAVAPAAGNPWRTLALAPAPAYLGTLAWRGPVSRVRAFVARN